MRKFCTRLNRPKFLANILPLFQEVSKIKWMLEMRKVIEEMWTQGEAEEVLGYI
jgi:hypothetical protein